MFSLYFVFKNTEELDCGQSCVSQMEVMGQKEPCTSPALTTMHSSVERKAASTEPLHPPTMHVDKEWVGRGRNGQSLATVTSVGVCMLPQVWHWHTGHLPWSRGQSRHRVVTHWVLFPSLLLGQMVKCKSSLSLIHRQIVEGQLCPNFNFTSCLLPCSFFLLSSLSVATWAEANGIYVLKKISGRKWPVVSDKGTFTHEKKWRFQGFFYIGANKWDNDLAISMFKMQLSVYL